MALDVHLVTTIICTGLLMSIQPLSGEATTEPEAAFKCTNGEQVHLMLACDGYLDCEDGSDEKTCTTPETPTTALNIVKGNFTIGSIRNMILVWNDAYQDSTSQKYRDLRNIVEQILQKTCSYMSNKLCNIVDIHFSPGSVQVFYTLQSSDAINPASSSRFQVALKMMAEQMFQLSLDFAPDETAALTTSTTTEQTTPYLGILDTRILADKLRIISVGGDELVYRNSYQDVNTPEYKALHETMTQVLMTTITRMTTQPARELQMTFRDGKPGIIMEFAFVTSTKIQSDSNFRYAVAEEAYSRNILMEAERWSGDSSGAIWGVVTQRRSTSTTTTVRLPATQPSTQPTTTTTKTITSTSTKQPSPILSGSNLEVIGTTEDPGRPLDLKDLPEEAPALLSVNSSCTVLLFNWLFLLVLVFSHLVL